MITSDDIAWKAQHLSEDDTPESVCRYFLIKGLSPLQKQVYDLIVGDESVNTSPDVQQRLGIAANHAGNVLARLTELTLLERAKEKRIYSGYVYQEAR